MDFRDFLKNVQEPFLNLKDEDYELIKESLSPLMECIDNQVIFDVIGESIRLQTKRLYNTFDVLSIISKSKSSLNPKEYSTLLLMSYLSLSEGHYSEFIQLVSYLLVKNHHDIYNPYTTEFVKKYGDLEKIPFFIKLKFVKNHGFKNLLKTFDKKLRNSIAHMTYEVDENGYVSYNKTKLSQEELRIKLWNLFYVCKSVYGIN